jgi:hypothetical protein
MWEMRRRIRENPKWLAERENIKCTERVVKGKIKKSGKDKEWTVSDRILCRGVKGVWAQISRSNV